MTIICFVIYTVILKSETNQKGLCKQITVIIHLELQNSALFVIKTVVVSRKFTSEQNSSDRLRFPIHCTDKNEQDRDETNQDIEIMKFDMK